MSDESIGARIERLVAEEHGLRAKEERDSDDDAALAADKTRLFYSRRWDISWLQPGSARFSAPIRQASARATRSTRFVIGTATSCRRTSPSE